MISFLRYHFREFCLIVYLLLIWIYYTFFKGFCQSLKSKFIAALQGRFAVEKCDKCSNTGGSSNFMKDVQTQSCFCTVDQFSQTPPRELKLVYDVTEKYRTPVLYENKRKTETGEKHIPIYRKVTIRSEGRSKSRAKRVAMVDLSEAMRKHKNH